MKSMLDTVIITCNVLTIILDAVIIVQVLRKIHRCSSDKNPDLGLQRVITTHSHPIRLLLKNFLQLSRKADCCLFAFHSFPHFPSPFIARLPWYGAVQREDHLLYNPVFLRVEAVCQPQGVFHLFPTGIQCFAIRRGKWQFRFGLSAAYFSGLSISFHISPRFI